MFFANVVKAIFERVKQHDTKATSPESFSLVTTPIVSHRLTDGSFANHMIVLQVLDNFLPSFVLGVTPLDAMYFGMIFPRVKDATMRTRESLRLSIPVTTCHAPVGIFMLFFMLLPIEVILVGALTDGTSVRAEALMQNLCVSCMSSMLLAQGDLVTVT